MVDDTLVSLGGLGRGAPKMFQNSGGPQSLASKDADSDALGSLRPDRYMGMAYDG